MADSKITQFQKTIQHMLAEHLQVRASDFSNEEVVETVRFLLPKNDPIWKEKLTALFHGLATREQLELAGKELTGKQALQMVEASKKYNSKHHWKLSPLFVGVSHPTFVQLLAMIQGDQLEILQHEALTESIQHHLTVLAHDAVHQQTKLNHHLEDLAREIERLDPLLITTQSLAKALSKLEDANDRLERWLVIINRALALAWNTNRTDLVEKFNDIKDHIVHTKNQVIGIRRTRENPSTGIYTLFDRHITAIYGDNSNPEEIEALQDSEPAIEALTKFSLWYMKDYWELGLLPQIKSEEELKLDPLKATNSEEIEYREALLKEVFLNLKKLGLVTVGDFKNAHILSREMLKQYIQKRLSAKES